MSRVLWCRLSGVTTALSWAFNYCALKLGEALNVALIDNASLVALGKNDLLNESSPCGKSADWQGCSSGLAGRLRSGRWPRWRSARRHGPDPP